MSDASSTVQSGVSSVRIAPSGTPQVDQVVADFVRQAGRPAVLEPAQLAALRAVMFGVDGTALRPNAEARAKMWLALAAHDVALEPVSNARQLAQTDAILDAAARVYLGAGANSEAIARTNLEGVGQLAGLLAKIAGEARKLGAPEIEKLRGAALVPEAAKGDDIFVKGPLTLPALVKTHFAAQPTPAAPGAAPAAAGRVVAAFDPVARARELNRLMAGDADGTKNERRVLDLVHGLTGEQRVALAEAYAGIRGERDPAFRGATGEKAAKLFRDKVVSEFSGPEKKIAARMLDSANQSGRVPDHDLVALDVSGWWSQGGRAVEHMMMTRSEAELAKLDTDLRQHHGYSLRDAIDKIDDRDERRKAHFMRLVPDGRRATMSDELKAYEFRIALKDFDDGRAGFESLGDFYDKSRDHIRAFSNTDFSRLFRLAEGASEADMVRAAQAFEHQEADAREIRGQARGQVLTITSGNLKQSALYKRWKEEITQGVGVEKELWTKRLDAIFAGGRFDEAALRAAGADDAAVATAHRKHQERIASYLATTIQISRERELAHDDMFSSLSLIEATRAEGAGAARFSGRPSFETVQHAYARAVGVEEAKGILTHAKASLRDNVEDARIANVVAKGRGADSPEATVIRLHRVLESDVLGLGLVGARRSEVEKLLDRSDLPAAERGAFMAEVRRLYAEQHGKGKATALVDRLKALYPDTAKAPDGTIIGSRTIALAERGTLSHVERLRYDMFEPGATSFFGHSRLDSVVSTLSSMSGAELAVALATQPSLLKELRGLSSPEVDLALAQASLKMADAPAAALELHAHLTPPAGDKAVSDYLNAAYGPSDDFLARNFASREDATRFAAAMKQQGGGLALVERVRPSQSESTAVFSALAERMKGGWFMDLLGNERATMEASARELVKDLEVMNERYLKEGVLDPALAEAFVKRMGEQSVRAHDYAGKLKGRREAVPQLLAGAVVAAAMVQNPALGPLAIAMTSAATGVTARVALGDHDLRSNLIAAVRYGADGLIAGGAMQGFKLLSLPPAASWGERVLVGGALGAQGAYSSALVHNITNPTLYKDGTLNATLVAANDALDAVAPGAAAGALLALLQYAAERRIKKPSDGGTVDPGPTDPGPTDPGPGTGGDGNQTIGRPDTTLPERPGGGTVHGPDVIGRPDLPQRPGGGTQTGGVIGRGGPNDLPGRGAGAHGQPTTTPVTPVDPGVVGGGGGGGTVGGGVTTGRPGTVNRGSTLVGDQTPVLPGLPTDRLAPVAPLVPQQPSANAVLASAPVVGVRGAVAATPADVVSNVAVGRGAIAAPDLRLAAQPTAPGAGAQPVIPQRAGPSLPAGATQGPGSQLVSRTGAPIAPRGSETPVARSGVAAQPLTPRGAPAPATLPGAAPVAAPSPVVAATPQPAVRGDGLAGASRTVVPDARGGAIAPARGQPVPARGSVAPGSTPSVPPMPAPVAPSPRAGVPTPVPVAPAGPVPATQPGVPVTPAPVVGPVAPRPATPVAPTKPPVSATTPGRPDVTPNPGAVTPPIVQRPVVSVPIDSVTVPVATEGLALSRDLLGELLAVAGGSGIAGMGIAGRSASPDLRAHVAQQLAGLSQAERDRVLDGAMTMYARSVHRADAAGAASAADIDALEKLVGERYGKPASIKAGMSQAQRALLLMEHAEVESARRAAAPAPAVDTTPAAPKPVADAAPAAPKPVADAAPLAKPSHGGPKKADPRRSAPDKPQGATRRGAPVRAGRSEADLRLETQTKALSEAEARIAALMQGDKWMTTETSALISELDKLLVLSRAEAGVDEALRERAVAGYEKARGDVVSKLVGHHKAGARVATFLGGAVAGSVAVVDDLVGTEKRPGLIQALQGQKDPDGHLRALGRGLVDGKVDLDKVPWRLLDEVDNRLAMGRPGVTPGDRKYFEAIFKANAARKDVDKLLATDMYALVQRLPAADAVKVLARAKGKLTEAQMKVAVDALSRELHVAFNATNAGGGKLDRKRIASILQGLADTDPEFSSRVIVNMLGRSGWSFSVKDDFAREIGFASAPERRAGDSRFDRSLARLNRSALEALREHVTGVFAWGDDTVLARRLDELLGREPSAPEPYVGA